MNAHNPQKPEESLNYFASGITNRGYQLIHPKTVEEVTNNRMKVMLYCPLHKKTYTVSAMNFYKSHVGRLRCCRIVADYGTPKQRLRQAAVKVSEYNSNHEVLIEKTLEAGGQTIVTIALLGAKSTTGWTI